MQVADEPDEPDEPTCRSCGSGQLHDVVSLGDQPLANALRTTDDLALPVQRHPLDLCFCAACGLVQITVSVPPEQLFRDYAYFSSFSPTVVANAKAIVDRLVAERRLGPRHLAMEVASNDGYLLKNYLAAGVGVLGIEPAQNIAAEADAAGVPTECDFFGVEMAARLVASGRRADVIHANNVMAHVPDPNGVVAGMEHVLADDGVAVIETPYVRDMIEKLEFDTIYHEHLFYYSLTSFSALLHGNGLEVLDVERIPIHGGSLRIFAARAGAARPSAGVERLLSEERSLGLDVADYYQGFGERVEALCASLRELLGTLRSEGNRIAGYAAAAKTTVLLTALGLGEETIDFVVDRSPHKQGRYLPGVPVPIVPVERLLEEQPEYVVLFAWNFAEEVLDQQSAYRERGGRFIIPVPTPRIV